MASGRWPDKVKDFRKWATDQVDRGTVAGNKVTSSRKINRRRRRRIRRRNNGSKD